MKFIIYIALIVILFKCVLPLARIALNRGMVYLLLNIYAARSKDSVNVIKGKACKRICSCDNNTADYILITSRGVFVIKLLGLMNTLGMLIVSSSEEWCLSKFIRGVRPDFRNATKKQIKSRLYITDLAAQVEAHLFNTGHNLLCVPVLVFAPSPAGVYVDTGKERLPLANGSSFMGCYFTTCKRLIKFIKKWENELVSSISQK